MEHFQKGTEFQTYKELLDAKCRYEHETKTLLTTKKSAKYGSDDPRCEDLVYSRIQYQCKAGEELCPPVEQEFDAHHNTSDDDSNDGPGDPLSDMYEKCGSDDDMDNSKNAKLKKDFDAWFKDLIPGEKLSYNEWLWQLEFNFPSLDKLNFIKYGIILGMTILNKYYFDGSMTIDGNGIKEAGAEFGRKRKKHLRPVLNFKDEDDEDDEIDNFGHDDDTVVGEAEVQINEDVGQMTSPTTCQPSKVAIQSSSTSTPIIKSDNVESVEPTRSNSQPDPINCKMCPQAFPTHSQLYHHMCKFHTGHIGRNCPVCNKRFQYERNLNLHIESVHGTKGNDTNCTDVETGRSICEICGASFDKMSSLRSHSRYVHSIEKFYCQYCNRKLSSKKSLKEHIQFQHELTFVTHECEDCQRIFKYKSSYRLHMKKQHGIHFG